MPATTETVQPARFARASAPRRRRRKRSAAASRAQVRGELTRLLHRGGTVPDFALGAARVLSRAVPFDGICILTMDPATLLFTGEVTVDCLPPEARVRMAEIEIREKDINCFDALVRSGRFVASLSDATDGDLNRSLRHRELRGPHGFGDELRSVLVSDTGAWGALTLLRAADCPDFTPADVDLLTSVHGHLVEGLRRAMLHSALSAAPADDGESAGLALLGADNSIALADPAAERWLSELRDGDHAVGVPAVVAAIASRARAIAAGDTADGDVARARVRTSSGTWLSVRGSMLGAGGQDYAAVTLEPARPHELAPLIADAYGLTDRERTVTQLVAQGHRTDAIADRLHISAWTVQDHLKAIFEKVGVSTRGEVIARMFFDHYAPRLAEQRRVGWEGWFEAATPTSLSVSAVAE
jgi:DNA-binding CsgD family transcriptional regulator